LSVGFATPNIVYLTRIVPQNGPSLNIGRPLWVTSSLSASYQPNGWFRVHTGHSEVDFAGAAI